MKAISRQRYEHRGAERGKNKANKKEPNSNESVSHNFKTYESTNSVFANTKTGSEKSSLPKTYSFIQSIFVEYLLRATRQQSENYNAEETIFLSFQKHIQFHQFLS